MLKEFVLGSEIAKAGNFHIANISMTIKEFGLTEGVDYLKYGGMTLLWKKSNLLPKNVKDAMFAESITDLSDYLPFKYFIDEMENQTRLIKDRYKIVEISGKKFVKITDKEFHDVMFNEKLVKCVVESYEIPELVKSKCIDGYIKLSNQKALTWY